MIEKKVDIKILITDVQMILPTDECKPLSKFDEKFLQVPDKAGFQFSFQERFFERQEIKNIRVFESLLGHKVDGGFRAQSSLRR